ncbi:glutamate--tRNA ligase family protein [Chondrinema litorale]|uniref:glutamate--tRNA ligase family protein n=1 Tax=Chondrinema litorale TaxID=2994555 RepID=UPI00254285B1|nr:glutamate--tRNA ligase family protein [Chondrinema litorale]UZR95081.1 glutamate--tRNA ligase family protein [Chondrinema litorale]
MEIRSRIAPTPSGYLHFGNIFSFVITWLYTRKQNGKLLLRIDDLDKLRIKQKYIDDIFATLNWLEIDYDEGPSNTTDFLQNYSQHLRLDLYNNFLRQLKSKELLFACQCSRKKIKKKSKDGLYPGTCLHARYSFGNLNTAWRLKSYSNNFIKFSDSILGEVSIDLKRNTRNPIMKRKDGLAAYQIATLTDDLHFKINTIVRGKDLLNSTAIQIYLANCLQKKPFKENTFLHHRLIKNQHNQKISKSKQASPVHLWREKKDGKIKLLQQIAVLLNVEASEISNLNDLLLHFKIENIHNLG